MAWGEQLAWLSDLAESGETPKALLDRPELPPHLEFVFGAFWELTTDRQIGMGIGPIPWSARDRFCERNGIESADGRARFHRLIGSMDGAYLGEIAKKKPDEGRV